MALSRPEALESGSARSPALLLSARVQRPGWQPTLGQLHRRVSMKETPAIFHSDSSVANWTLVG